MTPSQIEAAARELCRMRQINPEQEYSPGLTAWQHAEIEVRRFAQVGTAIAAVMQPPRVPRKRKTILPTREDLDAAMRRNAGWMDCQHKDTQAIDPVHNNGEVLRCVDCGARKPSDGAWRRP